MTAGEHRLEMTVRLTLRDLVASSTGRASTRPGTPPAAYAPST